SPDLRAARTAGGAAAGTRDGTAAARSPDVTRRQRAPRAAMPEVGDLVGDAHAQQKAMAVAVEAEGRRQAQSRSGRQAPGEDGRQVVRGVLEAETCRVAEAAVELDAGDEVLAAEGAGAGARRQRQRPAEADSVPELPGRAGEVLLEDQVLGQV